MAAFPHLAREGNLVASQWEALQTTDWKERDRQFVRGLQLAGTSGLDLGGVALGFIGMKFSLAAGPFAPLVMYQSASLASSSLANLTESDRDVRHESRTTRDAASLMTSAGMDRQTAHAYAPTADTLLNLTGGTAAVLRQPARNGLNASINAHAERQAFAAPTARGAAPSLDPAHLRTLELHGFKPVDVIPGTNGKVAIIGRPMGGETIGKAGRPTGVHDYADALKKRGYEVEVYNPPERGELERLVTEHLVRQNIPVTREAIQATRLPDAVIKTTKSYQNNLAWAKKMKDEGYTVIDIGNNSGSPLLGAYYEGELGILFPGCTR